jgi:hypothetical protein
MPPVTIVEAKGCSRQHLTWKRAVRLGHESPPNAQRRLRTADEVAVLAAMRARVRFLVLIGFRF